MISEAGEHDASAAPALHTLLLAAVLIRRQAGPLLQIVDQIAAAANNIAISGRAGKSKFPSGISRDTSVLRATLYRACLQICCRALSRILRAPRRYDIQTTIRRLCWHSRRMGRSKYTHYMRLAIEVTCPFRNLIFDNSSIRALAFSLISGALRSISTYFSREYRRLATLR